jgi:hypothetical protein
MRQHAVVLGQPVGVHLFHRVADASGLRTSLRLPLCVVRDFVCQGVLEHVNDFRPDARAVNQLGRPQRLDPVLDRSAFQRCDLLVYAVAGARQGGDRPGSLRQAQHARRHLTGVG